MSWSNALPTVSSFPTRRSSDLRSGPEVVAHDTQVHAVRHAGLRLLGLNTFADGDHQIGSLTVDGPASVLAQDDRGRTVIAVSDPTFARETVSVTIRGRRPLLEADDEVTAHRVRGGTRLDFRTHQAYGKTLTATLRGGGIA